jgi:hypothetical protein
MITLALYLVAIYVLIHAALILLVCLGAFFEWLGNLFAESPRHVSNQEKLGKHPKPTEEELAGRGFPGRTYRDDRWD